MALRFFAMHGFNSPFSLSTTTSHSNTLGQAQASDPSAWWNTQNWDEVHEAFGTLEQFNTLLCDWVKTNQAGTPEIQTVKELVLIGGTDKTGREENIRLLFKPGEVVCVVGPTGSGKSRLLADIECLAQGDTPSARRILLNGEVPDEHTRFSVEKKLVAQISQNMNFVMDVGVADFLTLHAESRGLTNTGALANEVLERAIALAGEAFSATTPLTQLSGGQSRALMIADAAFLSPKPIVLIDEIENAGVDRQQALSLFVERGKLVFLSTHDPLLALSGDRRIVIRQGGIHAVLETSPAEQKRLKTLVKTDREISHLRDCIRRGDRLD